jgi:hypothetical protein
VRVNVSEVRVSVSPLDTVFDKVKDPVQRQLPPVGPTLSKIPIWEMVAVPALHEVHDGFGVVIARWPPEAVSKVSALRPVSVEALTPPVAPGSPVYNLTQTEGRDVRNAFAWKAVRPTGIRGSPQEFRK